MVLCLGAGLQWENVHKPVDIDDDFTVLHCIGLLIVDITLYGLITWYVDAVKPGKYGVAKPFYFPFTVRSFIFHLLVVFGKR